MSKKAWYNWTGDSGWNEYCAVAWLLIFIPGLLYFGFVLFGLLTGMVKLV